MVFLPFTQKNNDKMSEKHSRQKKVFAPWGSWALPEQDKQISFKSFEFLILRSKNVSPKEAKKDRKED